MLREVNVAERKIAFLARSVPCEQLFEDSNPPEQPHAGSSPALGTSFLPSRQLIGTMCSAVRPSSSTGKVAAPELSAVNACSEPLRIAYFAPGCSRSIRI